VILIVGIVSAIALPTIKSAMDHRQASEAARILQGALIGARDAAIHSGQPAGIRLLPDPVINGLSPVYLNGVQMVPNPRANLLDPSLPLASNRVIPIEVPPQYTEGSVSVYPGTDYSGITSLPCLVLEQAVTDPSGLPLSPTSWFWNVRVGERVQINGVGVWYTVVGPTAVASPEGFVNQGQPGSMPLWTRNGNATEVLFLVNGRDDNSNGWIDEGADGVDNNGNGIMDDPGLIDLTGISPGEWEQETWVGAVAQGVVAATYAISRRPVPISGAREIALPSNVVVDLTTWSSTRERSRVPLGSVNGDGSVDILINPDGTMVPTTRYSTPASVGMDGAFVHLWLSERSDVFGQKLAGTVQPDGSTTLSTDANGYLIPIPLVAGQPIYLPPGHLVQQPSPSIAWTGQSLGGEYRILTLFARTGKVGIADNPGFDNPLQPVGVAYNASLPFIPTQQGLR